MNTRNGKKIALLLVITMISMSLLPYATAYDTDMDGTDDSVDDCVRASGTSSIDRTGCPDRDGDGTSDITDGWTTPNPNFQTEFVISSNNDYTDIDYSPTGEFVVTVEDGQFVRIWNSTSFINVLSGNLGSSNTGTSVAYSPDGNFIAAGMSNDAINIWYAANFTSVNGEISVDVGSGDQVNDVEFSPDNNYVAVSIGRSGNSGTNGQTKMINVSTGIQDASYNPSNEDRFYDAAFSPDGGMLAMGGNGDWFIVNTSSGSQAYSNSGPSASVNGIAWSPDGNYIALCIGYSQGSSRVQLMKVGVGSGWTQQWIKTHSTSCYAVDFSPDGSQVVFGMGYYQASGSTAFVYDTVSGISVDAFDFRPSSGCSGQSSPCGTFNGID
jgi:WD40 repeat protein